ncbi:receptor-type tyrosine-protein phosphatase alpha-like, partial [Ylistrum balloti]|uniref:receptor-type tyrosine-protein phosphatase alpha-like n=1 Tax=Ylistrum balloti TaxID=509963 RepID=UPI0029058C3D
CVSRKHGTKCEDDCPVNCTDTCEQDTGNCNECVSGKHGTKCEDDCPVNCKDTCGQDRGNCNECISGKRGTTCEDDCPVNCQDTCEQDTGNCSGCIGGFFGTYCMENCSSNCSECEQESGVCTKCMTGLYGMNCNMSCGHCSICEQNSGVCVTCDPGYEGIYCETKQAEVSDNPTPSTNAGSIAGPIAGVLAILVIAVVIAIYIRRRRQNAGKQDTFDDIGRSNKLHRKGQSKPLETENSRSEPVVPPEHNVYSNVLLDPDYPTKGTGNVYVNAEQVASASRSGDSVYYNSGPVGFPVSTLKSLVHTKMQNKAKAFENEFKSIPYGALHEHKIGMLPQNKTKNRFKTTFPYDHSRVILDKVRNDPHSDYINANYIDSVTKTAAYIATQGPRTGTVNDFWRMIWQLKSDKIVMLTNVVEEGRPKCDKYWPDEGEPLATPHFNIILDRERTYAFYVLRDLTVTEKKTKSERQIHQFHYTTWPDHGTPDSNELVVFHRRVKHYPSALPGKMVIHCSAGIGRTGTFIALDALLDYGKEFEQVDVLQYIKTMRKDRINMVQTNEQYIAIHQLLAEAFDLPDTLIPRMTYNTTLNTLSNGGPTNQTKLRKEYQQIQPLKPHYGETECKAALLPNNKMKNKISTVLAADKFRAYLRSQANGRTDYINAVVVPSYTSQTGYIVTQTPTEDTVVDLLTMIMDHDCTTIVIIDTDTIVWLPEQGKDKSIGEFTLEHKGNSSTVTDVDLIEISIENEMKGFHVKVRVFHLTGWEQESSVPQDSSALLQLLELVDSRRKSDNTKTTAVMCRDGFSQSGLFCCISNARDQMKGDDEVDIFQITRQLQVRRPEFIVNFDQYQFCYNMIKEYLDTTDVYMN